MKDWSNLSDAFGRPLESHKPVIRKAVTSNEGPVFPAFPQAGNGCDFDVRHYARKGRARVKLERVDRARKEAERLLHLPVRSLDQPQKVLSVTVIPHGLSQ